MNQTHTAQTVQTKWFPNNGLFWTNRIVYVQETAHAERNNADYVGYSPNGGET